MDDGKEEKFDWNTIGADAEDEAVAQGDENAISKLGDKNMIADKNQGKMEAEERGDGKRSWGSRYKT